ncbi:unnamed protein product [Dovyalis caffra]|uniref:Uncharacterized protein n=1 Tax=Dovyalis caffra TaxID=77055 RepID=A0AAV1SVM4_9ROSI|nr:unnamed protein product [Dovyalis caffra]
MENFRSKSCREGRIEMEGYHGGKGEPTNMQDLRSYSVSYAVSVQPNQLGKEVKIKKGKSNLGSSSKSWSFNDPELRRKRRVANYKVYAMEGKMKGSFRKSFRWIKDTCTQVVYGWRLDSSGHGIFALWSPNLVHAICP